jgi:hypothetical protein
MENGLAGPLEVFNTETGTTPLLIPVNEAALLPAV